MERKFTNILLLGLGFMFLFTAFQTMANIEKTLLTSISHDEPDFKGDGYTSLAIIYAALALCNWLSPSAISVCGPRGAMLIGAITYCMFMISFLNPTTWLLYLMSAILGAGAALIWTGQGIYLSRCSTPTNISRNSGIFWAMLQASMFFGNLFVFYQFDGDETIQKKTRELVLTVLIAVAILGVIFLTTLQRVHPPIIENGREADIDPVNDSIVGAFKNAIKLFFTREMLLLSITFLYTGFELSFYSGVYSPSIGFTVEIGGLAKKLIGLSGICIGVGEVSGGILFGLLGSKTTKWGKETIVVAGMIIHLISFLLIFLNLPNESPFGDTKNVSFLNPPLVPIALLCSLLLGFGDACFNTQIYSVLGGSFAGNSAAAFALFKFTQSIAAAVSFVYSSHFGLRLQLSILVVFALAGTACFVVVERSLKRIIISSNNIKSNEKYGIE